MTEPAQTAEPTVVEVVEQPADLPAVPDARNEVIERASEAALMPGAPGRDEFIALAMTARILSMSAGAPKAVRDNPYLAFHLALVGRDLGISPSASLAYIDPIGEGDKVTLSLSPQLLNAQIRRLGLGSIVPGVQEVDRAVAVALGPGGRLDHRCWPGGHVDGCGCKGIIGTTEFTWADAQTAGIVMRECQPSAHTVDCLNYKTSSFARCHQGYRTYPSRMCWWRAASWCANDWFPEAGLGLYQPEELGATVDEEGRPIDPSTIELPEGYQPEPEPPVEQVSDEDKQALAEQIHLLPAPAVAELRRLWQTTLDDPLPTLTLRQLPKARALIAMVEGRALRGEWDDPPTDPAPSTPPAPASEPQPEPVATDITSAPEPQEDPERVAMVDKVRVMRLDEVRKSLVALGLEPQGQLPQAMRDQLVEAWLAWVPPDVDGATGEIAAETAEQGDPK